MEMAKTKTSGQFGTCKVTNTDKTLPSPTGSGPNDDNELGLDAAARFKQDERVTHCPSTDYFVTIEQTKDLQAAMRGSAVAMLVSGRFEDDLCLTFAEYAIQPISTLPLRRVD